MALAQLLPSVSMFWRYDNDNNRYLVFKHWQSAGFRASWDLLTIPAQLQQREVIKLQTKLVGSRRTALAVAILTQLHLSLLDCAEAAERLEVTGAIAERRQRLLTAIESAVTEGTSHDGECLDQRLKFLRAHGRYLRAFANLMVAEARLLNTVGRDALIEANGPESLEFDLPTPADEEPESEETDADGS